MEQALHISGHSVDNLCSKFMHSTSLHKYTFPLSIKCRQAQTYCLLVEICEGLRYVWEDAFGDHTTFNTGMSSLGPDA